jgi:hypothetical protein
VKQITFIKIFNEKSDENLIFQRLRKKFHVILSITRV